MPDTSPRPPPNPMIARILEGTVTDFEIKVRNARIARKIAVEGAKKNCDPEVTGKRCFSKHCHHGNPRWVAAQHAHADVLEQEAADMAQDFSS